MKSTTEWMTRIGDALKPHNEAEKKAQAISAFIILIFLIIVYILVKIKTVQVNSAVKSGVQRL